MLARKIVKAGPSSHTIALPKDWMACHQLKKGDLVYVHEGLSKELLITPSPKIEDVRLPKEKLIEVDGKSIETLQREITSAYINNCSLIILTGSSISEKAREVRRIVHNFIALEITEQSSVKMQAKDFLNLSEVSVEKTIKRMDMIIRTMLEDVVSGREKIQESVELRDEDVNRLYFLLVRLLKSSLLEPQMAKQLEVEGKNVLRYWQIVHDLESLADYVKQACSLMGKKRTNQAGSVYHEVQDLYMNVMKAFYQNDKKAGEEAAQKRGVFERKMKSMLPERSQENSLLVLENVLGLCSCIGSLARQVIDNE